MITEITECIKGDAIGVGFTTYCADSLEQAWELINRLIGDAIIISPPPYSGYMKSELYRIDSSDDCIIDYGDHLELNRMGQNPVNIWYGFEVRLVKIES